MQLVPRTSYCLRVHIITTHYCSIVHSALHSTHALRLQSLLVLVTMVMLAVVCSVRYCEMLAVTLIHLYIQLCSTHAWRLQSHLVFGL